MISDLSAILENIALGIRTLFGAIFFLFFVFPLIVLYRFFEEKCPKCKKELRYTGYRGLMVCDYCGYERDDDNIGSYYDPKANAAYIKVSDGTYYKSKEVNDDIILDFDKGDNLLGIEILSFEQQIRKHPELRRRYSGTRTSTNATSTVYPREEIYDEK